MFSQIIGFVALLHAKTPQIPVAIGNSMTIKNILWRFGCVILACQLFFGVVGLVEAQINVANYGAKGDLLTLNNINVVSNSTSVTCVGANFTSADVNKLIEIFGGSSFDIATNGTVYHVANSTLFAYIVSVVSPSSIIISTPAKITANGLTGVYGTDSRPAFANAIANCPTPIGTIVIPAGNYLLIPDKQAHGTGEDYASVIISRGGITFVGQGNVTLTGQGGHLAYYDNTQGRLAAQRSTLFEMLDPMVYNYPLIFTNLSFDGGINGYCGDKTFPPWGNGIGWDMQHHAMAFNATVWPNTKLVDDVQVLNCTFHGWRGEMIIGTTEYPGGYMVVSNSVFYDGQASALNVPMAHDWNACTFSNMLFVEEFFRSYSTNPVGSIMRNCVVTNLFGDTMVALNGGYFGCPTYTLSNNNFYGSSQFSLLTAPACNVLVISNRFIGGNGIGFGSAGYQGYPTYPCNSNIVVAFNYFTNISQVINILGTGQNRVENISVISNRFDNCSWMGSGYGWSTNVVFSGNVSAGNSFYCNLLQGQYFIETNNAYALHNYESYISGDTNKITYGYGGRGIIGGGGYAHTYFLDDAILKIPSGASLTITNSSPTISYQIYPAADLSGVPVTIGAGQTRTFYWNKTKGVFAWMTNKMIAPQNLHPLN